MGLDLDISWEGWLAGISQVARREKFRTQRLTHCLKVLKTL